MRQLPRLLVLFLCVLIGTPSAAWALMQVDSDSEGCPDDGSGSEQCPPFCPNCACAPAPASVDIPRPIRVAEVLTAASLPAPEQTPGHVPAGYPSGIFHPPRV